MRCPKCHYLSFEPESRCRNCGYDFSFAHSELTVELDEPDVPLSEIVLQRDQTVPTRAMTLGPIRPERERDRDHDHDHDDLTVDPILVSTPPVGRDLEELPARQSTRPAPLKPASAPIAAAPVAPPVTSPAPSSAPPAAPVSPVRSAARAASAPSRPASAAPSDSPAPPVEAPGPIRPPSISRAPAPAPASPVTTSQPPTAPRPVPPARAPGRPPLAQSAAPPAPAPQRPAVPAAQSTAPPIPPPTSVPTAELPLFVQGMAKGAPMDSDDGVVSVPAAPAPLAVRRRPVDQPRKEARPPREVQPARPAGPVDRDLLEDLERIERTAAQSPVPAPVPIAERADRGPSVEALRQAFNAKPEPANAPVSVLSRVAAALIDLALLAGINVGVVWFTLRWCELPFGQAAILPLAPFLAFLLLIDGGYLLMFTAATGQTVGKMAVGIRVVAATDDSMPPERVTFKQALLRELCTFPSVLVLGAGFVPALMGDRLALHDRLSHTRVVRA